MKNNSTMVTQLHQQSAPNAGKQKASAATFADVFRKRQDVFMLIKQLIQMIKAVQRHRGLSMGLLGGNSHFQDDFSVLQQQLANRLELFMAFVNSTQELLGARDQDNLRSAWLTISHDWQQDSVIDNYELHCHLIEHLLGLVATLAKQLEQPMSAILNNTEPTIVHATNSSYPNRFKQLEVLHFTTRLMPAVAEQIGRIRALATYLTALGHCNTDYASKLRYVIQCTKINNEKLRHHAKRMEGILMQDSSLLNPLKSYEIKLNFLLDMVEQDVLKEDENITADSNRLFDIATNIIDMYLHIVDEGTVLLELWHQDEIEHWLAPSA